MKRCCAVALLGLASCVDSLDEQTSRIDRPRVLAVIASPAEAAPRDPVTYTAAVAAPDGPVALPAVDWALCTAPKPPTEDDVVPPPCLDDPGSLLPLGTGATVAATLPANACSTYGPDTPPGGFRPRDPDASGGYYQPVRAAYGDAPVTIGLHRIACNLADAPPQIASEFRARYVRNQHPTFALFTVVQDGMPVDPAMVVAGQRYTLVAAWPLDAAEAYVVYDRATVTLRDQRESMRVGWFATAGALAADATGVAGDDVATSTHVDWTAPSDAGAVHLWAVLHDDRGGVAVRTVALDVH